MLPTPVVQPIAQSNFDTDLPLSEHLVSIVASSGSSGSTSFDLTYIVSDSFITIESFVDRIKTDLEASKNFSIVWFKHFDLSIGRALPLLTHYIVNPVYKGFTYKVDASGLPGPLTVLIRISSS